MKKPTLRRGKPDDRTHFQKARDDFKAADKKGTRRSTERTDTEGVNGGCPICHEPMLLRRTYVATSADGMQGSYKFEGICSTGKDNHHILRYGYFASEAVAAPVKELDA